MAAYYWMNDIETYSRLIDRIRPIVEARGTPPQRSRFFDSLLTFCLRRDSYVVAEETVGYARAALDAAEQLGDASSAAWARFELGFTLLWADRLVEAAQMLQASLREADRIGDVTLRSRALTYVLVLDRKRDDPNAVERSVGPVIEAAREASLPEYEAIALAGRSWVHARAGRVNEAESDARAALDRWRALPVRYPFEWMALWPLVGIALERGQVEDAVELAADMLAEHQQPLPEVLRTRVANAVQVRRGNITQAREELRRALPDARRLTYL